MNVVAPGLTETEMGRRLARAAMGVKDVRELDSRLPFGRVAQPSDVTGLDLTQARKTLAKAHCTVGSVTRQRKAKNVALQKPAAQTRSAAHGIVR